ncbi:HIRAN domain-containing protein [Sphingosinicella sp.]|uniref:HIRAN domain-containing protein n=1 Tax=Sphingosinicella sp. TaxID=1917971 RepID=UPI0035B33552
MAKARIYDIVGESQINKDGSARQTVLRHCEPGDPVKLLREPKNAHDRNAIFVTTLNGRGVGYIKRDEAPELARRLDAHEKCSAQIQKIKGGMEDYPSYGVMVSVAFVGETHPKPDPLAIMHLTTPLGGCNQDACLAI